MDTRPTLAASAAQRRAWRRSRLRDAALLLPVFGAALLILPDLVLSGSDAAEGASWSWLVYLFAAWAGLVVLSATISVLSQRLEASGNDPEP
ncbi:hypothetical protein JANAI62_11840 [Jannaschia pagri]|uniref:Uncharacterized protein n=1 Tax=Jannaschia pagri TaxID=2829797 RepID=A0ABQ4NJP3_9RHOB|nr:MULTISPECIES: hypothetical protein [unclassified Jannaschia]GIT90729.1 hypothetical protein JANAI61_11870 [Jannaschia sp. AI_61]GIT94561.1 hypothetical protein JANAI62_11840 [Jannaschia sp. AI_62]